LYAALQILAELTQTYKDANVGAKVTKFLTCAQPFINLAITIIKNHEWTLQEAWERRDELPTQDESFSTKARFALKCFCINVRCNLKFQTFHLEISNFSFQCAGISIFSFQYSNILIFIFLPNISQRRFKF
jgi:hypothetical protein